MEVAASVASWPAFSFAYVDSREAFEPREGNEGKEAKVAESLCALEDYSGGGPTAIHGARRTD